LQAILSTLDSAIINSNHRVQARSYSFFVIAGLLILSAFRSPLSAFRAHRPPQRRQRLVRYVHGFHAGGLEPLELVSQDVEGITHRE